MTSSPKKPLILCAITLDTEPDCDINWRITKPIAFSSVTRFIPELYRPLWNKYDINPTYFTSPSVIKDDACIRILKNEQEQGAEIGAHLHPEYIEPQQKYSDASGTVADEFTCSVYSKEVEFEKIKNFTELIEARIGRRPISYRAGRFGADLDTIQSLKKLGYRSDSSVTPFIDWTTRGGPDHSNAPIQPYYVASENFYEANDDPNTILKIPLTIFGKRLGRFGRLLPDSWLYYQWLRPTHMTVIEQKRLISKTIQLYQDQPIIVFTMMFHSMETVIKGTPFVRSKIEQKMYLNRLTQILQYLKKLGCQFVSVNQVAQLYRENNIIPELSTLKRGLRFNNYLRYKNISAKQYNKRFLPTYFFWRMPSDRILMPLVKSIHHRNILDVGCGTGCYTNFFTAQDNRVLGVDKNVHLATGQSFPVIESGANDFKDKVPGKYDLVFSSWLADYLGPNELQAFIQNSHAVLEPNGELIFTAISPKGWGGLYIWMARHVRHVKKYCYRHAEIRRWMEQSGFSNIEIIPMNSWLKIPWAYIVKAKKPVTPPDQTMAGFSQPIKIGLLARGLTSGGVTRFINNVLSEFDNVNNPHYQFVLFTDEPSYQNSFTRVKVAYVKKINKILWEYFQIFPSIRREKCHYMIYPKCTIPLTHLVFSFKKLVVIHDLAFMKEKFLEYKLMDTIYLKLAAPISCNKADYVLAVSEATKQDAIRKMGLKPDKLKVIFEAVEERFKQPVPQQRIEEIFRKLNIEAPYLFYCGVLSPRKNALRMFQAFAQVKDQIPHNFYVTASQSWYDADVRQFIKDNLADRVFFLGYITEEELRALYQRATLYLYPSIFEGFGLPILEAQASGCPVLTSNVTSCPEIAGRGAYIVDPYSIDDIRDGIIKIISNESYRQQLIEYGKRNLERFSWGLVVHKILALTTHRHTHD
ncbi:MAG: glycosyltransferase [Patescibacteria group bacterium]|jgi:glycosyltransferase involved in cell wall biosynthesis/SAM-dependent methyltransferase